MKAKSLELLLHALGMTLVLSLVSAQSAVAGDGYQRFDSAASSVHGWRLGPGGDRSGLFIYRETGYGWQQVPGSAVQLGGSSRNPWAINNRNRIYYWNGRNWDRMPGSALSIADGWVIGTKREHGGYGIYRWNGRNWDQAPGGAVSIGGSYDRPWVVNDRNQRFVWNGYDWDRAGSNSYGGRVFQNSFGGRQKNNAYQRYDGHDNRNVRTRDRRRYSDW